MLEKNTSIEGLDNVYGISRVTALQGEGNKCCIYGVGNIPYEGMGMLTINSRPLRKKSLKSYHSV